jgi:hypothetical protein
MTTVTVVRPAAGGGYQIEVMPTGSRRRRKHRRVIYAAQVVFAAGALGTQRLLHAMKTSGALPHLSARLGELTRTNSEAILGASVPDRAARRRGLDFTQGVAITSSFYPDPQTHIEPVRYGAGSNAMGLLQSVLVAGGRWRRLRWLGNLLRQPMLAAQLPYVRRWSQRTIVALVMQARDNSLTLGCDCLGEIHYFDGVVNNQDGEAVTIPNAVCMHEEDVGVGWKHTDFRTDKVEVRRLRRLVISTIVTVGNYEYGYFWYLTTDGMIEYEVKLTGVISTGAVPEGVKPKHGTLVAPGLYGPHHQHFFCVRLDMAVDGNENSVVQVDSEPFERSQRSLVC